MRTLKQIMDSYCKDIPRKERIERRALEKEYYFILYEGKIIDSSSYSEGDDTYTIQYVRYKLRVYQLVKINKHVHEINLIY